VLLVSSHQLTNKALEGGCNSDLGYQLIVDCRAELRVGWQRVSDNEKITFGCLPGRSRLQLWIAAGEGQPV
jgi:hypothetical protein